MILLAILLMSVCLGAQAPAGEWFTVAAGGPEVAAGMVQRVQDEARFGLAKLQPTFPGLPNQQFQIFVHGSAEDLPAELKAVHHPGSPGFSLPARHEIHILAAETTNDAAGLSVVIAHEIVHELLGQLADPYGEQIPRWAHEGIAQVLTGDTYLGASEENIVWRVTTEQLLPFGSLESDFPRDPVLLKLAYAQSFSYLAWIEREIGRRELIGLIDAIDKDTSFLRALVLATRRTTSELEGEWHDYLLHSSGAQFRSLLSQCFSILMILALPLLALAVSRRMRNETALRRRLEAQEREQPPQSPDEPYTPPVDDYPEDDESAAQGEASLPPTEPGTTADQGGDPPADTRRE